MRFDYYDCQKGDGVSDRVCFGRDLDLVPRALARAATALNTDTRCAFLRRRPAQAGRLPFGRTDGVINAGGCWRLAASGSARSHNAPMMDSREDTCRRHMAPGVLKRQAASQRRRAIANRHSMTRSQRMSWPRPARCAPRADLHASLFVRAHGQRRRAGDSVATRRRRRRAALPGGAPAEPGSAACCSDPAAKQRVQCHIHITLPDSDPLLTTLCSFGSSHMSSPV